MPRTMPVVMKLEEAKLLAGYAGAAAEAKLDNLKHGEDVHYTHEEVETIRKECAAVLRQVAAIQSMGG